ncbi:hypothetical protein [Jannaschia pohangensis]|uniref:Uncharacterized protein n=1 Tax=Jannaschia pohangensis TaxID=390807 RepID=A0A1I3IYE3_9RHOB|nr:hypothetical protein [Jannaschia pohangensis]SFI52961.1 hypothetical protein SAMN04488095_1144 [Jannaschia pohangensis]
MDETFAARIARIEAASQQNMQQEEPAQHRQAVAASHSDEESPVWTLLAIPICFALGFLSILIGKGIDVYVLGNPDITFDGWITLSKGGFGAALVLSFALDRLLPSSQLGVYATTAGFIVGAQFHAEIANYAPVLWDWMFANPMLLELAGR